MENKTLRTISVILICIFTIAVLGLVTLKVVSYAKDSGKALSNDEIIQETKKCRDAGLEVTELINGFTYRTIAIICKSN